MKRLFAFAIVILFTVIAQSVQAQDIRIDLSNLVSTTSGNWNNISNLTGLTSNLIDFPSGSATGVSIDGTGSPWLNYFGDNTGSFPNQAWLIQPAAQDGAGLDTGLTGSFLFTGLTNGSYKVEIVSARSNFNYLNTITVDGVLASSTQLGTPVNTPWGSTSDGLTPGNWLIWDNVTPVGGQITITDIANASTFGIINAIRISAIPEPTTWALIGVVTLGTGIYGWNKRRQNLKRIVFKRVK